MQLTPERRETVEEILVSGTPNQASAIAAALADLDACRGLLRQCEWGGHYESCPACGSTKKYDHEPGCRLAAVLTAAGGDHA